MPTFKNASKVMLVGSSAGGFGVLFNYHRVAQAFCPTPTVLLDDSGPVMSDTYLSPCLQQRWRTLWKLNMSLPAACPECSGSNGGGLVNMMSFLGRTYPSQRLGLISSNQDSTITIFFGYGKNNCSNIDSLNTPLSGATYTAGLNDLRMNYLSPAPSWSSYYINSTTHTYLLDNGMYNTTVMNVKMTDWINGLLTGAPAAHVGP